MERSSHEDGYRAGQIRLASRVGSVLRNRQLGFVVEVAVGDGVAAGAGVTFPVSIRIFHRPHESLTSSP